MIRILMSNGAGVKYVPGHLWTSQDFKADDWPRLLLPRVRPTYKHRRRSSLQEITWRLGELEPLASCVTGLSTVFLRRLGARAIFATHLHELAANVAALNASITGLLCQGEP